MYNITLSHVPLHKNRTIFVQIGRPHFKDIINHFFKKLQIVFLRPTLIVFIKIESRKDSF